MALEMMRQRAMRDTERRLAGDVLAEAVAGRLTQEELRLRLRPFGVGADAATLVFSAPDGGTLPDEADLDRFLVDAGVGALVASRGPLLCAVVDGREGTDPLALAEQACEALEQNGARLRAAASRVAPVGALRNSFHEARCALEAAALANGQGPRVASHRDLGAFQLLLSLQDEDVLRLYCDSVLGPARGCDRRVRRRADPLARDLHRAERPVGARRARALLPPAYPALPDTPGGAAHRARPVERARSDRVLAGAAGARARHTMKLSGRLRGDT